MFKMNSICSEAFQVWKLHLILIEQIGFAQMRGATCVEAEETKNQRKLWEQFS